MHIRPLAAAHPIRPVRTALCAAVLSLGVLTACTFAGATMTRDATPAPTTHLRHDRPIVIAHRGASGYRPEHTLAAYELAIRQGADFIEPDLVATKDGVLIARHENEISGTTDVATRPEFASRKATKVIDGTSYTGWFTEDFNLAEIKTLRAKERIPAIRPGNVRYDGKYEVPTFAEVVRLAQRMSREGRVVGVYPETKHPTYFAREGRRLDGTPIATSLGARVIETLVAERFTDPRRVFIQSFEVENLLELRTRLMPHARVEFPLVQLFGALAGATPYDVQSNATRGADMGAIYGGLDAIVEGGLRADTPYGSLATREALGWMQARYASGIGPWKADLLPREPLAAKVDADGDGRAELATRNTGRVHPMLGLALEAGLLVHPYTLRAEEAFLTQSPDGVAQTALDEALQLFALGVQGLFIDQPDVGVAARAAFMGRRSQDR